MRTACSLALLLVSATFLPFSTQAGGAQTPLPSIAQQPTPESSEVQDADHRALYAQVLQLFQSAQYAQIDSLAQQLRTQKTRYRGGGWQLTTLYQAIASPGAMTATDVEWQALIDKLQSWISSYPKSPTPRIALAQAYTKFAWKARGNGFANTVTPQGWSLFRERIQSARAALDDGAAISVNCPEWYRAMQVVALAQGWPRKQVDALVQNALAHNPEYFPIALAEANYLLPKWYGKPGDTEAYATQVADTIGGREGDIVYFFIAAAVNCCRALQAPAMDETRVQRGFTALDQLYGLTNRELNMAAFLALRAGDTATAQALFTRIGNNWAAGVWGSKARFDASRTGQPVGNVRPIGPPAPPPDQGAAETPSN